MFTVETQNETFFKCSSNLLLLNFAISGHIPTLPPHNSFCKLSSACANTYTALMTVRTGLYSIYIFVIPSLPRQMVLNVCCLEVSTPASLHWKRLSQNSWKYLYELNEICYNFKLILVMIYLTCLQGRFYIKTWYVFSTNFMWFLFFYDFSITEKTVMFD